MTEKDLYAALGVPRTADYYQEYAAKLLLPGLGKGSDRARAKELIEMESRAPAGRCAGVEGLRQQSGHVGRLKLLRARSTFGLTTQPAA